MTEKEFKETTCCDKDNIKPLEEFKSLSDEAQGYDFDDNKEPRAFIYMEEKVKEFIKIIKEDNGEGIRMIIKMYPHKSGEELASQIIEYLNTKVMPRRAGPKLTK